MQTGGKKHLVCRSLCSRRNCSFTLNSSDAFSCKLIGFIVSISFLMVSYHIILWLWLSKSSHSVDIYFYFLYSSLRRLLGVKLLFLQLPLVRMAAYARCFFLLKKLLMKFLVRRLHTECWSMFFCRRYCIVPRRLVWLTSLKLVELRFEWSWMTSLCDWDYCFIMQVYDSAFCLNSKV